MTAAFPRGFKAWCETAAAQQRKLLGLRPDDPLDPSALAKHLRLTVWNVDQIPGVGESCLGTLLGSGRDEWSAVTLQMNGKHAIVLNSIHSRGRTSSDLAHELSHILLGHDPARGDVTVDGMLVLNTYDKQQEEEAKWLGGCLLLPRDALVWIRRRRMPIRDVVQRYGVSQRMVNYRMRVAGVDTQFERIGRRYGRSRVLQQGGSRSAK